MDHPNQTRIMQNGAGWYWEVVTNDRDVIARGIADTHALARANAEKATPQIRPTEFALLMDAQVDARFASEQQRAQLLA
jgi:hypothetical protein